MFLSLADKINLTILIELYLRRGKELAVSHKILDQIPQTLHTSSPELFLMDSLYFNQGIFEKIVNGLRTHFIVKSRDAGFREILEDYADESLESKGFDVSRICLIKYCNFSLKFRSYFPDKSYEYRISCQWEPNDYGTPSYYAGIYEGFNAYNTRQYTTISVSLKPVDFTGFLKDWKTLAAISGASITLVKPDGSKFSLGSEKKNAFAATSGSDGSFAFNGLYQGVYRLHITNENYADTLVQVFGIYHDMLPFVAYQNPLSDSCTGRVDPLELTVMGVFPGYTDNGNGITYAGITHVVDLGSSAAMLYDYQWVYVDIDFPPEAEGNYGEIYINCKLGTDPCSP